MKYLKSAWVWFDRVVAQPIKARLIKWSERPQTATFDLRRWIGFLYLETRHDEWKLDLWGYIIIPGCIVLVLLLLSAPVWAEDVTVSWQAPTGTEECAAGTVDPILAGYRILQVVASIDDPAQLSHVFPGQLPGEYTYLSTAIDTEGNESRLSNEAIKTVTSFQVSDDKAYTVAQSDGKFVAFIIGTVPVGTACNPDSMVKGEFDFLPFTAYGVPVTDVTITGDTEPVMVVATCH